MNLDCFMLPLVEATLVAFALFAAWRNRWYRRVQPGSVKRGPVAMRYFYGAFAASTAILIWLPLSVETAKGYRVPLLLINVAVPAYLCFFNAWFRNKFLGWISWVSEKVEG